MGLLWLLLRLKYMRLNLEKHHFYEWFMKLDVGKVAVGKSGSFNIVMPDSTVQGISYKYCKHIQACDGYKYNFMASASSAP